MLQILEDNNSFMILVKPAGMSVHNEKPSLADELLKLKKPLHFVNRLDRETSGLVVVAQKPEFHAPLAEALDCGEKLYRALLRGAWKGPADQLTWEWPLSDRAEGLRNPQGVKAEQKECRSDVQVLNSNKYFSEVQVRLLTGRQHQIRKHAALFGQPIVGDSRYNDKKYNEMIAQRYQTKRMWLHCEELNFTFAGKDYHFENRLDLVTFFS